MWDVYPKKKQVVLVAKPKGGALNSKKATRLKKKKESNKVGWEGLRKRQMKVQRTNLLLS